MRIDSISMVNVMKHKQTHVQFPQTGVLLVTGKNGQGKSSFLDAVAMGCWGKTLRGKTCWMVGAKSSAIIIESGTMHIERTRKGARTALTWSDDAQSFERTKDAQADLDKVIVPFDVWRRAAVISSADAMHFTLATDQERKKLVETVSGLDAFDAMCDRARMLRKDAAVKLNALETKHKGLEVALDALRGRRSEVLDAPKPKAPDRSRHDTEAMLARTQARLDELRNLRRDARARVSVHQAEVARIEAEQRAAARSLNANPGECPTCGTMLDPLKKAQVAAEYETVMKQVPPVDALNAARSDEDAYTEEIQELRADTQLFQEDLLRWEAYESAQTSTDARVRELDIRLLDGADELDALAHDVRVQTQEFVEYQATEQILSTKGIRAVLLAEVLTVLEEAANRWFAFVPMDGGVPLKLKLSPYTEKGNNITDALSLEVEGAGAGLGYKAASAGERRRIDLALMLALQEVAEAAHGVKFGTVFIDEAFDALDADVLPDAVEMLRDLAEDRCVMLITHNELVAKSLGDAMVAHMRVHNGVVQYV